MIPFQYGRFFGPFLTVESLTETLSYKTGWRFWGSKYFSVFLTMVDSTNSHRTIALQRTTGPFISGNGLLLGSFLRTFGSVSPHGTIHSREKQTNQFSALASSDFFEFLTCLKGV